MRITVLPSKYTNRKNIRSKQKLVLCQLPPPRNKALLFQFDLHSVVRAKVRNTLEILFNKKMMRYFYYWKIQRLFAPSLFLSSIDPMQWLQRNEGSCVHCGWRSALLRTAKRISSRSAPFQQVFILLSFPTLKAANIGLLSSPFNLS